MAGKAGRSGRKPGIHALKVLKGTAKPGEEPDVQFPEADGDAPPYWMTNEHALREWDVLFPLLTGTRIMTEADRSELAHLCMAHAEVVQMYQVNQFPSASKLGTLGAMYSRFGLNPANRSRVHPVADAGSKNPFAMLRKDA